MQRSISGLRPSQHLVDLMATSSIMADMPLRPGTWPSMASTMDLHREFYGETLGILATKAARHDILERWLQEGGNGHAGVCKFGYGADLSIGYVAVRGMVRDPDRIHAYDACLRVWLAWGGDPYASHDLTREAARSISDEPLRRCLNVGINPYRAFHADGFGSLHDACDRGRWKPPYLLGDGGYAIDQRMSLGEAIAMIQAGPDDHGVIVCQTMAHLMGFHVPGRREADERVAWSSHVGSRLATHILANLADDPDPRLHASWLAYMQRMTPGCEA
jgi:hypothetical protein